MTLQNQSGQQPGSASSQGTGPGASGAGNSGNPGGGVKTFTQEEVNAIVSKRVNEEKAKYEQAVNDQGILHRLMNDPDFQAWMDTGRSGGGQRSNSGSSGQNDGEYGNLQDDEGRLNVGELTKLIQQQMQAALTPLTQNLTKLSNVTQGMGMVATLQQHANTLGPDGQPKFPNLWNEQFRGTVMDIISRGRATNVEDAYYLASRDFEKQGLSIPNSAFLMESRGGGSPIGGGPGGGGGREQAPVIKAEDLPQNADIYSILNTVADRMMPKTT